MDWLIEISWTFTSQNLYSKHTYSTNKLNVLSNNLISTKFCFNLPIKVPCIQLVLKLYQKTQGRLDLWFINSELRILVASPKTHTDTTLCLKFSEKTASLFAHTQINTILSFRHNDFKKGILRYSFWLGKIWKKYWDTKNLTSLGVHEIHDLCRLLQIQNWMTN